MTITIKALTSSAADWSHTASRWAETTNRVAESGHEWADNAADVSRGLRLVAWLLRNGHQPADAVRAMNAIGLRTLRGQRWTVPRLRKAVVQSEDAVRRANADGDPGHESA